MQEEQNLELMLRVSIRGGGCSGFEYGFSFEEQAQSDDYISTTVVVDLNSTSSQQHLEQINTVHSILVSEFYKEFGQYESFSLLEYSFNELLGLANMNLHSVSLLIDPISSQYLRGASIDYKTGVTGEHFAVNNPNAKTTCGCGSSFSVATE